MLIQEVDSSVVEVLEDQDEFKHEYEKSLNIDEKIKCLQKHFYPPQQTPKNYLSLIPKVKSSDERISEMNTQLNWESNPMNWLNFPTASERLHFLIENDDISEQSITSKVVLMALQLVESEKNEYRLKGMELVDIIFNRGHRQVLLHANLHHVYCNSLMANLILERPELNLRTFQSIARIASIVDEADRKTILDDACERCFTTLFNSCKNSQRKAIWTGLAELIKLFGLSFVRHFQRFFEICDYCVTEHSSEESELILYCIIIAIDAAKERAELRKPQIERISMKLESQGIDCNKLKEII